MEQQLVIYLVVLSRGHVDVEVDALYRDRYTTVPYMYGTHLSRIRSIFDFGD